MDLNRYTTKIKAQDLLLLITESTDILVEQTRTKPQETLEFKLNRSYEYFPFESLLELEDEWMIGLISIEVYNSIQC